MFDLGHGAHGDRTQQGLYQNDGEQNICLVQLYIISP